MKQIFLLLILIFASPSLARDWFVNNVAGDDIFSGEMPTGGNRDSGPFRTIARALKSAQSGDRIVLAKTDEPYRESVSIVGSKHSGTATQPFTVEGNGAILDGSRPVPNYAWEFVRGEVFRFQPEMKNFQQLFLDGRPVVRRPYSPLTGKMPVLQPLEWLLADGWVYFRVEPGRVPQQYNLSYAALPVGITVYKAIDVAIYDLVVQGFALDGINLHDAEGPTTLAGLNCRGNGRGGVAVCGASVVDIQGSLLGDNGQAQLHVEGYSQANLSNCDVLENTAPGWQIGPNSKLLVNGKPAKMAE